MKIGISGTRGIPNAYGGFEQFAQYLSAGLVKKGHDVFVYCSSLHPYQEEQWNGVQLVHCTDMEDKIGTAGQFIYDFNCFTDAQKRNFDVLLQLGYTSSSLWYFRWPDTINIVNMDGLEWKRSKYNNLTQKFLEFAEKLAVNNANVLVADSMGIKDYLQTRYSKTSVYIPYGAEASPAVAEQLPEQFQLRPFQYHLVVARMEPENNIEMVIRGYLTCSNDFPLVIVGNTTNSFGIKMKETFTDPRIRFIGAVYDQLQLNTLRHFASIYFHGHSVGGTNPSLLEAMGCECRIAAHNNVFNKAVLGDEADYFSSVEDVKMILETRMGEDELQRRRNQNLEKIKTVYNWDKIIDDYEQLFYSAIK